MTPKAMRRRTATLVVAISVVMWILLFFNPGGVLNIRHCPVVDVSQFETLGEKAIPVCAVSDTGSVAGPNSFRGMLDMNPMPPLMLGWGLMLLAMMLPLTIFPVLFIMQTSLKRKRLRLSLLFLSGYLGTWMLVGLVMVPLGLLVGYYFPGSWMPAALVLVLALVWECSPIKQRSLNRGHRHLALAAFGRAADRDALGFGMYHGRWCVVSCWALMLWPMFLSQGHELGMLFSTIYMVSGHFQHPQQPGWEFRLRPRLFDYLVYEARVRLG